MKDKKLDMPKSAITMKQKKLRPKETRKTDNLTHNFRPQKQIFSSCQFETLDTSVR